MSKTLKNLTLKEVENLCINARNEETKSEDIFLEAFVLDIN